jgi:hypothetical protein
MALSLAGVELLPPLLVASTLDRYFLPAAAVIIPLLASKVSLQGGGRLARAWALGSMAVGLGVYVVGEQDYQAWQRARFALAQSVYASHNPATVDAGYEMNGTFWELPHYDATGSLPPRDPGSNISGALGGPRDPQVRLEFTQSKEQRSMHYDSMASGWISAREKP